MFACPVHAFTMLVAKQFTYEAKKVFDKPDTAKLKDAKTLNDAGNYLQSNPFGLAVVAAHTDMKGDTEKDRLLTEARSMVARDYLVKNFKLEDTKIKTIGWESPPKSRRAAASRSWFIQRARAQPRAPLRHPRARARSQFPVRARFAPAHN